jgi:MSHA pilin protein MshA
MNAKQQGFTLVELVVVIVILGVLAATALPRFINVTNDARIAAVNGIAGGLRSSVGAIQARYFATGTLTATTVTTADATSVAVNAGTGIPTGVVGGIAAAMGCESATACNGVTLDLTSPTATTWRPSGGSATCQAAYNGTTGVVTVTTSGC